VFKKGQRISLLQEVERPMRFLHKANKFFPYDWKKVDAELIARKASFPDFPKWCFLPLDSWSEIYSDGIDLGFIDAPPLYINVAPFAAIATWRYSQGVYRIDEDVFSPMGKSRIGKRLNAEDLLRLPEFCIYIETPGMTWEGKQLFGYWTFLDWDDEAKITKMHIVLDVLGLPIPFFIHLGDWSLEEAVARAFDEVAEKNALDWSIHTPRTAREDAVYAAALEPFISMLLCLCTEEPDIDDSAVPGSSPAYPQMKKTKGGLRLFAPEKPRLWHVGRKIGNQLREAIQQHGSQKGATERATDTNSDTYTMSPHLRCAHWHRYWVGSRGSAERRKKLIWLNPILINMADNYFDDNCKAKKRSVKRAKRNS